MSVCSYSTGASKPLQRPAKCVSGQTTALTVKCQNWKKMLPFFLSNSRGDKHPLAMKPAEFKLIMNTSRSAEACAVEIKGSNRQVSPCHFKEEVSCEIVKS